MEKPKPNNDKHIELSEEDLKKVAGGKMAAKQPSGRRQASRHQ